MWNNFTRELDISNASIFKYLSFYRVGRKTDLILVAQLISMSAIHHHRSVRRIHWYNALIYRGVSRALRVRQVISLL